MNPDDIEVAKAVGEAAMKEVLGPFTDIIRNLTGPPTEEIGLAARDSVRAWRAKRAVALRHDVEAEAERRNVQLRPINPAIAVPMLEAAVLEDDEDMRKRWASLLVSAASQNAEDFRGLSEILRQLTPAMAKFIDRAFDETIEDYRQKIAKLSTEGENAKEIPLPIPVRVETAQLMTETQLAHLERLGLLRADRNAGFGDPVMYMFGIVDRLYLSPLAKALVKACRPGDSSASAL